MKKGEISDPMATRLISDCLSEAGSEFAREFNQYLDSGPAEYGKATIGKFVVPIELTRKFIPSGIQQRSFRIEPDSEELALCA